jgi:hypothetical protein
MPLRLRELLALKAKKPSPLKVAATLKKPKKANRTSIAKTRTVKPWAQCHGLIVRPALVAEDVQVEAAVAADPAAVVVDAVVAAAVVDVAVHAEAVEEDRAAVAAIATRISVASLQTA